MFEKSEYEFFEYDCPVQGIDFDVEPLPTYGSKIHCSACGGEHVVDETLGTAWRNIPSEPHLVEIDIDEWKRRTARPIVPTDG
jgi:hypothetical protein